ncbi:TetR/AcrR family transcriptional regulator [Streptomyces carpinensis]|uniref:TetR/AcrR family transcriptional regulator n=1 Tax=Streptomyces carpinensis TaxID=66369 RepID=A0ABV1W9P2_9ACTN|nr:TetR/AcrR family transcriptional regulator [Streptomyces carpinensis]
MTSSPRSTRTRKDPAERRAEILKTAARLALEQGLERVTMQLVAEELGVRPGLISHYFATVDTLLCEAFARAVTHERDALLPRADGELPATRRLGRFLHRIGDKDFDNLGRLWLNARHLARYRPNLRRVVAEQEAVMRGTLTALIEEGVRAGEFTTDDPMGACLVILVVIDGLDSYVNDDAPFTHPALDSLVFTMAERELGLPSGALRGP